MTEIVYRLRKQCALRGFQGYAGCLQDFEDFPHMSKVFLKGLGENNNVLDVNEA